MIAQVINGLEELIRILQQQMAAMAAKEEGHGAVLQEHAARAQKAKDSEAKWKGHGAKLQERTR